MALVSWKAFQFFDGSQVRLPEGDDKVALDQANISSLWAGTHYVFVGSFDGRVQCLDQTFKAARAWKAHDQGSIAVVRQVAETGYLITIAQTLSSEPQLRVWALDQQDRKSNTPRCLCTITVKNALKAFPVTAFAAAQDLTQLAVGFGNGAVTVIRGDFVHEKGTKQRTVFESQEPVTGLEFREAASTLLYIGTTSRILALTISGKGQGTPARTLDEHGCAVDCMKLDPESNEVIVAREDAILAYGPRGKAASHPYECPKKSVNTVKDYVLVVSPKGSTQTSASAQLPAMPNGSSGSGTFTILNTDLKLLAFTQSLTFEVNYVFVIWDDIFLLSLDGRLFRYHEKSFQQKLELMYQRDLYVLAINLAQKYKADAAQQSVIFRKYGDYLYKRGDYDTAMQQYLRAIDSTEPSQIIRQFLDHQRIKNLIEYLEELHEHGTATSDHTTLLLNCYAKLKDVDKLETFIKQPGELKFDLDTAISMCRQAGYNDQAAYLARRHEEHGLVVDILIEDLHRYAEALAYIQRLQPSDAFDGLKKFGTVLLEHCPQDTTELCISYFTGTFRPKKDTVIVRDASPTRGNEGFSMIATSAVQNLAALIPLPYMSTSSTPTTKTSHKDAIVKSQPQVIETSEPGEYVPYETPKPREAFSMFIDHDDQFLQFLEACLNSEQIDADDKRDLYTALFEMYLRKAASTNADEKEAYETKARALIEDKNVDIDVSNVMLLSDLERFNDGTILICERQGLLTDVFRSYAAAKDTQAAIKALRKYGQEVPSLYPAALAYFTSTPEILAEAGDEVEAVLTKIDREGLMAPLQVVQALSQNSVATTGLLKKYLTTTVNRERAEIEANRRLIASYRQDTLKKNAEITELGSKPTSLSATRCSSCSLPMDLPAVHFLCKHSFHQRCLNIEPGQENDASIECPICAQQNETVKVIRAAQKESASRHDLFKNALEQGHDHFATISDWFGRGVMDAKPQGAS